MQEEKGMAEDEMIKWHYGLNGHEFEQTMGGSGGQRWRTEEPDILQFMGLHDLAREQPQQHIFSQVRESCTVHLSQLHFLPLQITNKNLDTQVGSHACPQGRAMHHMWLSLSGHFGFS